MFRCEPTGAVVSIPPPPGDDTIPTGVSLVSEDGAEIVRFDDCPGLNGEAAHGEILAFACADGVLLVDGEAAAARWTSTATWSR